MDTDFTDTEKLGLAGAVLTGIAAFLPWVTAGVQAGPVDVDTSASGIEGLGILTLLLAVLAVATVMVLNEKRRDSIVLAASGIVVMLVGLWKILSLGGAASPGIGLYLTVLGGAGILVAGLWDYRATSTRSTPEATR